MTERASGHQDRPAALLLRLGSFYQQAAPQVLQLVDQHEHWFSKLTSTVPVVGTAQHSFPEIMSFCPDPWLSEQRPQRRATRHLTLAAAGIIDLGQGYPDFEGSKIARCRSHDRPPPDLQGTVVHPPAPLCVWVLRLSVLSLLLLPAGRQQQVQSWNQSTSFSISMRPSLVSRP